MAHEAIFGSAILLGGFALPCSAVTMTRDGPSDVWAIRVLGLPTDALRPLRTAIGPSVARFSLSLTDYAGRVHRGHGVVLRSAAGELGYQLDGDDLTFSFQGDID
jgi:hypothetical protein